MVKKCIICDAEAGFRIKDGNEFYCKECAQESFADLSMLQKVEQSAIMINNIVQQKTDGNLQDN